MKKRLKILIILIFVLLLCCIIAFTIYYNKNINSSKKPNKISTDLANNEESKQDNIVKIINGKIENETIIDEFINNATTNGNSTLEIIEDSQYIILENITGEFNKVESKEKNSTTVTIPEKLDTAEDYEKAYGYYKLIVNNEEKGKFDKLRYQIKRKVKDNEVCIYFNTWMEVTDFQTICTYSLNSSQYNKKFDFTYNQRKDLGVKQIARENEFDNKDYGIYTFGRRCYYHNGRRYGIYFRKCIKSKNNYSSRYIRTNTSRCKIWNLRRSLF